MRVLASADVHGRRAVFEWLLTVARQWDVDATVLAGDLLGCPDGFDTPEEAQRHDAKSLIHLLDAARVPVLYIMGNDDLVELDSQSARVQSIHARRVTLGSFNFVGYQYSLPFMGGVFEKPEGGIESDLAALTSLVAHGGGVAQSGSWCSRPRYRGDTYRQYLVAAVPRTQSVSGPYSWAQSRRIWAFRETFQRGVGRSVASDHRQP